MLILVGGAGAVLGLLLGLAIAWWWWPVEWENSTPANLRPDFQGDYIGWVAAGYGATGDLAWARGKLGAEFWNDGQLSEALEADRTNAMDDHLLQYEGRAVELADEIIRVFHLARLIHAPIGEIIMAKMAYNETREHKHGKSY